MLQAASTLPEMAGIEPVVRSGQPLRLSQVCWTCLDNLGLVRVWGERLSGGERSGGIIYTQDHIEAS